LERIDCLVIGAGAVGLAVARALAMAGRETVILEAERAIGTGVSSRSSEVIHAGIYYPAGSLKARTCVEGRGRLYRFCAAHGVEHRRCGKLIVATTPAQLGDLEAVKAAAERNGVADLAWLGGDEARRLEPALACVAALHSPSTGILDTHGYMLALLGDAQARGVSLALGTRFAGAGRVADGWAVRIGGDPAPVLTARWIINAAGLGAQDAASRIEGLPAAYVPAGHLAKGVYFTYAGRTPFRRLIYPVPEPGGLGTHLTLDLAGAARFGPDVEWVDRLDFGVDPAKAAAFATSVRGFWPGVDADLLQPGYAGIRPKISGPGAPNADFVVSGPADHGLAGVVNLFGIESPGITASLALAEIVAAKVDEG